MRTLLVGGEPGGGILRLALEKAGWIVCAVSCDNELTTLSPAAKFDVAIIDASSSSNFSTVNRNISKKFEEFPKVWIVDGDFKTRIAALDAGADDCMSTPFEPEELLARLNAVVRKSTSRKDTLRIRDIEIDQLNRKIRVGKMIMKIPAREFSILVELVHNADRIVSKEDLIRKVWNAKQITPTSLVETQISRLRAKLADVGSSNLIETVRGRGYLIRRNPS